LTDNEYGEAVAANNRRITRLTALMAGHGFTFLQVYAFYVDTVQGLAMPHLRAQVVSFGAGMLIGVMLAYAGLMIPDTRPNVRRGVEAASGALLVFTWVVLGNAFLNLH
jgi:hypothetical protein